MYRPHECEVLDRQLWFGRSPDSEVEVGIIFAQPGDILQLEIILPLLQSIPPLHSCSHQTHDTMLLVRDLKIAYPTELVA